MNTILAQIYLKNIWSGKMLHDEKQTKFLFVLFLPPILCFVLPKVNMNDQGGWGLQNCYILCESLNSSQNKNEIGNSDSTMVSPC